MYAKKNTAITTSENSGPTRKEPEVLINQFWDTLKRLNSQTELFGYKQKTNSFVEE